MSTKIPIASDAANKDIFLETQTGRRICCFYVGPLLCGLDIDLIREITVLSAITPVHLAPPIVKGIVNMRGQIVTIIDLRTRLSIEKGKDSSDKKQAILVQHESNHVGLIVDRVEDILYVDSQNFEPTPQHMTGKYGKCFENVYKQNTELIAILNLLEILKLPGHGDSNKIKQDGTT